MEITTWSVLDRLKLLPKGIFQRVGSNDSAFSFPYLLVSLRQSSSCLRTLPRLPITSTSPSIFPSITWFRRQLLLKTWPVQLAFLGFIVRMIFHSYFTVCNAYSVYTRSVQLTYSAGSHSTPRDDYISRTQSYRIGSIQASRVKFNTCNMTRYSEMFFWKVLCTTSR